MTYSTADYEAWLAKRLERFTPDTDFQLTPPKGLAIAQHANDVLTGAFTVLGEIRNGSYDAKLAVAHTFANRHAEKPSHSVTSLCLAPWQYSCWLSKGGPANYVYLMTVVQRVVTALDAGEVIGPQKFPHLHECMYLVGGVLTGALLDNTNGSTHYYAIGTRQPEWAVGKTPAAHVGPHVFFNNIAW